MLSKQRRQQVLKLAEKQFAAAGLGATSTAALARAARISEAMLYINFGTKQEMFQEVLARNSQNRVAALRERFFSIPSIPPLECIARMAESAVLACVDDTGNTSVMAWGLMEMPEQAAEVYRAEIGATEALWDDEIGMRFAGSPVRTRLAVHLVPYVVHACMAFGFWLTALRHKPGTAQALARQYADGVEDAARAILGLSAESLGTSSGWLPAQRELVR